MKRKFLSISLAALLLGGTMTSCDEETLNTLVSLIDMIITDDNTTITTDDGHGLGWLEKNEDTEKIEDDIVINPIKGTEIDKNTGLPESVDLSVYLPAIGDQGQFGTCTAWAAAYNSRTWLYAKSKGVKGTSLSKDHIFSAADLFRSIGDKDKGEKCQGSSMEAALKVMVSRGVATTATVPDIKDYSECSCSVPAAANTEASKYKIGSYREVSIVANNNVTVDEAIMTAKKYLSEGRIILFGARLGDKFMTCNSAEVLTTNGTFEHTGIHAYHALVCVGYDDNKGTKGAFKVVNSWGKTWGDKGYVWIDQRFFCGGDFAYYGFVLNDLDENKVNSSTLGEGEERADVESSDVDLIVSLCKDGDFEDEDYPEYSEDPRWRTLVYDATNSGTGTVRASDTWGICYMLYNAFNANESEIVLFDLYSDKIGDVAKGECIDNWDKETAMSILGYRAQGFSISNVDIPGKTSVCTAVTGDPDDCFAWSYKMPDVTGSYYLVLIADAFNTIVESDDENNYHFLMAADGQPLKFENGVLKSDIGNNKALAFRKVMPAQNAVMPFQTAVNEARPNTYSPSEIASVIREHRRNGVIANKALKLLKENDGNVLPRRYVKVK